MKSWRNSKEYSQWKDFVISRDKMCVICKSMTHLHSHHIHHATYYPSLRFDTTNGIAICNNCHQQFHNNFKRTNRQKCDIKDFENFKALSAYILLLKQNDIPED